MNVEPAAADFLLSKELLLSRSNAKWNQYDADVIPAYVADMDFRVSPAIQSAIQALVEQGDYGYPMRGGQKADRAVCDAFVRRMKRLYGWEPEADLTIAIADLVQATFATVMAFSDPDDSVIVQVPNYPPFRAAIQDTGRKLLPLQMVDDGRAYVFDLEALAAQMTPEVKIFILCNPQNPTGRAFSKAELAAVLDFAEAHDLIVVSDEIHSDLTHEDTSHIPFASLGPRAEVRTITLNSATKSFNIPGLRTAVLSFGTEGLLSRFAKRLPGRVMGSVNSIGVDATVAAWDKSEDWLTALKSHLTQMRERLAFRLEAELPEIRFHRPEATYLAWLDCSQLGLDGTAFQFFHDEARVAFSPGENFEPDASSFVRLNFATSAQILDEIVDRMVRAVRANTR